MPGVLEMCLIARNRGIRSLLAALLVLSPLGCEDGEPDNVSISGKVVYADGKPLTDGMIIFEPVGEGDDSPMAVIREGGAFELSEVGIPPGEYRVMLAPSEEELATGEGEAEASSFQVPEKYLDAETSGWTATIKESGNEPLTFTIGE